MRAPRVGGVGQTAALLLDVLDSTALQDGSVGASIDAYVAGGTIAGAFPPALWGSVSGTPLVLDAGMPVQDFQAAGTQSLSSTRYAALSFLRPSVLGALGPFLRFTFDVSVRGLLLGAGTAVFNVAIGGQDIVNSGLVNGYGWAADSVRGGWRPCYKVTSGGPLVNVGPLLPFITSSYTRLGLRYIEGPVPTMEWRANGSTVWQVAGEATAPVPFTAGAGPQTVIVRNATGGTQFYVARTGRFTVERIG